MAIIKDIEIDGRKVRFKASAAIPRIYRLKYRRDIFRDMEQLMNALAGALEQAEGGEDAGRGEVPISTLDAFTLETFENIAYLMAKYADPAVPDSVEEWLDGFNTFSIYMVLPQLIELWKLNSETDVKCKKKPDRQTEN